MASGITTASARRWLRGAWFMASERAAALPRWYRHYFTSHSDISAPESPRKSFRFLETRVSVFSRPPPASPFPSFRLTIDGALRENDVYNFILIISSWLSLTVQRPKKPHKNHNREMVFLCAKVDRFRKLSCSLEGRGQECFWQKNQILYVNSYFRHRNRQEMSQIRLQNKKVLCKKQKRVDRIFLKINRILISFTPNVLRLCHFYKKIEINPQDHFSEGLRCPFGSSPTSEDPNDLLLRDNEISTKNTRISQSWYAIYRQSC